MGTAKKIAKAYSKFLYNVMSSTALLIAAVFLLAIIFSILVWEPNIPSIAGVMDNTIMDTIIWVDIVGLIIIIAINIFLKIYFGIDNQEAPSLDKSIDNLRKRIVAEAISETDDSDTNAAGTSAHTINYVNIKEKDIMELMLDNMAEIRKYYMISKSQAQSTFILSVFTCLVAVGLFTAAAILAFTSRNSVNPTLVTTVGGAVVSLFSGTALVVHNSAVKQLNHYYQALHENEQFLSTVNLVSKITSGNQDEVYKKIIDNSLEILKENAKKTAKE
jgi:uncharacterized membrane protein